MQTLKEKYFDKLLGLLQRVVEIDKTHKKDSEYFAVYHKVESFENQINYSFSQKSDVSKDFCVFTMKLVFKKNNTLNLHSRVQDLDTGGDTIHSYTNNFIDADEYLKWQVIYFEYRIEQLERELLSSPKS